MKLVTFVSRGLFFVLLALCASTAVLAQATGSIVGNVTDATGAALPGAKVSLSNLATNETRVAQAGPNGAYQFPQLPPGSYKVVVEQAGFQQFVVQPVQVTVGNASRSDASLQIGSETQTINVTSEAELLNTQTSSVNYEVSSRQVEQLPLNGRNPFNLAVLSPGVVPQGGSTNANPATSNTQALGNYQIGGGTSGQSATFIDGSPINIAFANSAVLVPIQDAVQEFQVSTNNVSPEYGRFSGGIINMATKPGTNLFHGSAYDYVRNAALNANTWFDKHSTPILPRPVYTQNQYGISLGGPIVKDKAFVFMAWEGVALKQATLTNTQVPTAAMLGGDFSAVSAQLYDPTNTSCDASGGNSSPTGTQRCAFTIANGYPNRNVFKANQVNPAALTLSRQLWPAPTNGNNPSTGATNFTSNVARVTDSNQWTIRGDENIGSKNKLFERFTEWHKNLSGSSALTNQVGNRSGFSTDQAVLGDTLTFTQTLLADIRASYMRYYFVSVPFTCCNYNYGSQIGPGWANIQSSVTFPQLPTPNVTGMYNFNTIPIQSDFDNVYTISVAMTKILGRHTVEFGGEMRKFEWDYAQSNSAGTTFNSPSSQGYTSSSSTTGATGGYGLASWLLGFPTYAQAAEPASSKAVLFYSGLYVNDSFRVTPKLTINAGLRWERPGAYTETHGRLTSLLLDLPQPGVTAALGRTVTGGLGLINSPQYPHKNWQQQSLKLFGPRVGFAYSPTNKWVYRGGFGITYLPSTPTILGPFVAPLNLATTTITSNGQTPTISLTNPFPVGIAAPISGKVPLSTLQANVDGLLGSGIQSALPVQPYPYSMQWNIGFQRQLGNSASVNVSYVGAKGNHLPLFSVNTDQLPNQYDICGTDKTQSQCGNHLLSDLVMNPLSSANGGPIPTSVPTLGQKTVPYGYLLKPYPQYLYMTADQPSIGFNWYEALQVSAQKRFGNGGVLAAAWTFSNITGTADTLVAFVEASRFNVGGGQGVQDNTNIRGNASNPGEYSRSSFQTPHRVIVNYVYPLPVGRGKRFLPNANGFVQQVVGNWTVNGLSTFQTGFPIAFQDNNPNALQSNYAQGYAGPVLGAGVTRPNFVAGCNPRLSGKPSQRLGAWYNTACYTVPGAYQFGNEPRVDPYIRAQGIDNSDFSAAKDIPFGERYRLDFRAEFFNIFNWTQFSVPNNQADNPASFGKVTAQYNNPRLIQMSGRFTF